MLGLADDLDPNYPSFRYLKIESREPFEEKSTFSRIPVMYWDRSVSNLLTKIPNGHFIAIVGRLESCPEIGLYVLAEQVRHFSSNLAK